MMRGQINVICAVMDDRRVSAASPSSLRECQSLNKPSNFLLPWWSQVKDPGYENKGCRFNCKL